MMFFGFLFTFVGALFLEQLLASSFSYFTPQFPLLVFLFWVFFVPAYRRYYAMVAAGVFEGFSSLFFGWWFGGFWLVVKVLGRLLTLVESSRLFVLLGLVFSASVLLQAVGLLGWWFSELLRDTPSLVLVASVSVFAFHILVRSLITTLFFALLALFFSRFFSSR